MLGSARIGDKVAVELITNRTVYGKLLEIKTHGVELDLERLFDPLTFYPFTNIISIRKADQELTLKKLELK